MASVQVKVKTCDRCAFGAEKRASTTRTFSIDDRFYETDLCDKHAEAFDRDLSVWTRIAAEIENPFTSPKRSGMFSTERIERARIVNAQSDLLKHVQEQGGFIARQAERLVTQAEEDAFKNIPGARRWTMSRHARAKMLERNYTPAEVLMAVTVPKTTKPSTHGRGELVCERDGCRVVVNPQTHIIVTVIDRNAHEDTQPAQLAAANH